MADIDAALVQEIFDIPQRERSADVHHHGQPDDLGAGLEVAEGAAFGYGPRLSFACRRLKARSSDYALQELLETVEELRNRGIGLISLEERIDTTSAAGELVFHVFGAIAHFERRLISERTKDGRATAAKNGRHPGRPKADPQKVDAALKLVAAGLSPRQAAKQIGIGRSTLYRIVAEQ